MIVHCESSSNMKLILKAKVLKVTGKTKHAIGNVVDGAPIATSSLTPPAWIGIARQGDGFFLMHLNAGGACFADTWHESLERAKAQAEFEFEISEGEWQPTDENVEF